MVISNCVFLNDGDFVVGIKIFIDVILDLPKVLLAMNNLPQITADLKESAEKIAQFPAVSKFFFVNELLKLKLI